MKQRTGRVSPRRSPGNALQHFFSLNFILSGRLGPSVAVHCALAALQLDVGPLLLKLVGRWEVQSRNIISALARCAVCRAHTKVPAFHFKAALYPFSGRHSELFFSTQARQWVP